MGKTQQKIRKGVRRCLRPNGTGRRITTLFMSLVLVLSLVAPMLPVMEVQAGTDTYTNLIPTADDDADTLAAKVVRFNGYDWYVIKDNSTAADAGSVTLLVKEPIAASKFDETGESDAYGSSTVKAYLDGLTAEGGDFADVAGMINSVDLTDVSVTGAKLYLLNTEEAKAISSEEVRKCARAKGAGSNIWWLCSPGIDAHSAACVDGSNGNVYDDGDLLTQSFGVRPALQLDLSKVSFDADKKIFSPIAKKAATPEFSPAAGTYTSAQNVTISADTVGATIYYTTDGTTPTTSSTKYTAAITVDATTTIKAIAVADGLEDSEVTSATFKIVSLSYADYLNRVVNFNGMEWYLIKDDSESERSGTVTLLAKECIGTSKFDKSGKSNVYAGSTVATFLDTYYGENFSSDYIEAIKDTSNGRLYLLNTEEAKAISSEEVRKCARAKGAGSNIWWLCSPGIDAYSAACVDGSNGNVYDDGDLLTQSFGVRPALQLDLSKVSFDAEEKTFSPVVEQVATPEFSPAEGTYTSVQNVTISTDTVGATIYYTTDDTTPTTSSTKYTTAITVDETTTIKAIAVKDGMTDSEVASAKYTISAPVAISYDVTFKVVNGSWDDGTTAAQTVNLTGTEGDMLKLTAAQIPAVGTKPTDGYKAGSWDVTPSTDIAITKDTVYIYTYAAKDSISAKVTFKVVNGSWDDGTTAAQTVNLTGTEGDMLKLTAAQIPAVGTKPTDDYKAGSWDVTPSTDIAITKDTVYIYTYEKEEEVPKVDVSGVTLDPDTASLTEGENITLTATVAPADASDKTVTFKSSDEGIATVDADGKITAVAVGSTVIIATATNGTDVATDDKTATCIITVTEASEPKTDITGVTLDKAELTVEEGKTETLAATVTPEDASSKDVIWSSSDDTIATIDADGVVVAVKAGTATITVTATNGTEDTADDKTATCVVTVTEPLAPKVDITALTLDRTTVSLEAEQTETLTATVAPEDATDKTITFTSSDEKIATVDAEGKITAVAEGSTVIIVTATNGTSEAEDDKTATCIVTVTEKKSSTEIPEEGTALVKDEKGRMVYYKDGEAQTTYSGLVDVEGIWYYVEQGIFLEGKTGFVMYEDGLFLVVEGKLETGKSGLVQDPYNPDIWYFLADGQVQTQYTGLALYDGEWFYVNKGRLDTTIAAYIEYDGGLFYVAAGRILKEVSGLAQDPNGPDWYFLAEGQAQTQYTGLAMYDGEWFYVVDGKLAEDYNGTVEYDGSEFNVVNGMVK